jgi:hypothetical protein
VVIGACRHVVAVAKTIVSHRPPNTQEAGCGFAEYLPVCAILLIKTTFFGKNGTDSCSNQTFPVTAGSNTKNSCNYAGISFSFRSIRENSCKTAVFSGASGANRCISAKITA